MSKAKADPNPVRPEHVELFCECVRHWQRVLGLHDWRITVAATRSTVKNAMAEVYKFDLGQRAATIRIGKDWGGECLTPENIDKTALHEVIHIFLYELKELALAEEVQADALDSAEHRIINILEVLLPLIPRLKG